MPRARGEAERLQVRESIMDGAARAFLRNGYESTKMLDIAAEAGCTPPTLYAYFSGKRGIFDALVDRSLDAIFAAFDAPAPGLGFEARLERLLRDIYAICDAQRDSFLYFLRLSQHADVGPKQSPGRMQALQERQVRFVMEQQVRTQAYLHHPPDVLATAFFSLSGGFLERWAATGGRDSLEAVVPLVMQLFVAGAGDAPALVQD